MGSRGTGGGPRWLQAGGYVQVWHPWMRPCAVGLFTQAVARYAARAQCATTLGTLASRSLSMWQSPAEYASWPQSWSTYSSCGTSTLRTCMTCLMQRGWLGGIAHGIEEPALHIEHCSIDSCATTRVAGPKRLESSSSIDAPGG